MIRFAPFLLLVALVACSPEPQEWGHALPDPLPDELTLTSPDAPLTRYAGREGCFWRHPGADAFRGDPRAALAAMGVPERTRRRLVERIKLGQSDGIVIAGRGGIISDKHVLFRPGMLMTFGPTTVCYNTTSDFDGTQAGKLYVEDGFYLWVPFVCGNITRLLPEWESRAYEKSDRNLIVPGVPRGAQPYAPLPDAGAGSGYRDVPEPSTIALFVLGIALMVAVFRIRVWRERHRKLEGSAYVTTGSTIFSAVWHCPTKAECDARDAENLAEIERLRAGRE